MVVVMVGGSGGDCGGLLLPVTTITYMIYALPSHDVSSMYLLCMYIRVRIHISYLCRWQRPKYKKRLKTSPTPRL